MAIDPNIKKKADDIRNKIYGREVRESLASGLEEMSKDVVENTGRQDVVEGQFQDVIENTTDKDVISAPEIIAARDGEPNLKARLDKENQEVTAQLAQTAKRMDGIYINPLFPPAPLVPAKADANYYDEVNKKYYSDSAMTIPATDNKPMFQAIVDYLAEKGGGTILAPSGTYCFHSGIHWKSKVSLIGTGVGSTKFVVEGELFSLLVNVDGDGRGGDGDNPEVWLEDCRFENFTCDLIGLTYTEPHINGKALFILYMKRARFENLLLMNTVGTALGCDFLVDTVIDKVVTINAGRNYVNYGDNAGGQSGIGIGTSALAEEPLVVSNCFTYNSGNYGIFVETQHNPNNYKAIGAKIVNCHAKGNRIGFANKGSGATQFLGSTSIYNTQQGISLSQGSAGDQIDSCIIANNGAHGIYLYRDYVGEALVGNNIIKNNELNGIFADKLDSSPITKNIMFISNKITDNGQNGIHLPRKCQNFDLKNNTIRNNGKSATNQYSNRGLLIESGIGNDNFNLVGNTFDDDQDTVTQLVGVEIHNGINYLLSSNKSKGSTDANAYKIPKTGGVIGDNAGMKRKVVGTMTMGTGISYTFINHYLNSTELKSIQLTPLGNELLWVNPTLEPNRIRVERESAVNPISFYYEIVLF